MLLFFFCAAFLFGNPFFKFSKCCDNAQERYVGACHHCGRERVKADSVTVLSVLLVAVPAHRLLPPSLRREQRAGCLCVRGAVCHPGRTNLHEKQPALPETCCFLFGEYCLINSLADILTKTGGSLVFFLAVTKPRVLQIRP